MFFTTKIIVLETSFDLQVLLKQQCLYLGYIYLNYDIQFKLEVSVLETCEGANFL